MHQCHILDLVRMTVEAVQDSVYFLMVSPDLELYPTIELSFVEGAPPIEVVCLWQSRF